LFVLVSSFYIFSATCAR